MKKMQNVTIKGTKEGIVLHLNDQCSYHALKAELKHKLLAHSSLEDEESPIIAVKIQLGNRYLTPEQEEEIKSLVRAQRNLVVDEIISNVITKEAAAKAKLENEIVSATVIVRSGQVLKVEGDLLLVGDVNPGGTVIANGNIFVMGNLRGIAHAGYNGRRDAVVVASNMVPSQIRIADCLNRAPDHYAKQDRHEMECAYIDSSNHIIIDRLQVLKHLRPNITRLRGGF
ncbi:putative septum site-determining protein MinC [Weizmannia acidilactici]|uniref:Probable septum site-determining protein MinC n=1 Tax=Weizmannia acidilactici TaxID=2607726 RepID=A0A5J4JD33_9BACI|nr:septum site-determining protein MinC [Weizmannia acidilactici]GER66194.1 putative septum site-determining protein MinC [Weizmannia acidilactici]GER69169.1 putative septum site-determining protein MinC [Weizmannia acidilactici]GER72134.1 putative septum site-determining protein MinC [Weizmannia acidilactici]